LSQLSRASPPSPLSIKDGEGEEVLAHGSWGGLRPDSAQLWRICAVFFWFFPFLILLKPDVETAETVFKGVQLVQITLTFVCIY